MSENTFPTAAQKEAMEKYHAVVARMRDALKQRRTAFTNENPSRTMDAAQQSLGLLYCESSRLWSVEDIAVIMGRTVEVVRAAIQRIHESPEYPKVLSGRLEKCSHVEVGYEKRGTLYDDRIFDLLVDSQVADYLLRMIHPKRESNLPTPEDAKRIMDFWNQLAHIQTDWGDDDEGGAFNACALISRPLQG